MPMLKRFSIVQWLSWLFALQFFTVVTVGHIPAFLDAQGKIFGLYGVTPFIDLGHFLAGLLAAICAWHSHHWATNYFKYAMIPFGLDAVVGILFSRDITEHGSLFFNGFGPADFSLHNILSNVPHILTAGIALWIGWWLSKKVKKQ